MYLYNLKNSLYVLLFIMHSCPEYIRHLCLLRVECRGDSRSYWADFALGQGKEFMVDRSCLVNLFTQQVKNY